MRIAVLTLALTLALVAVLSRQLIAQLVLGFALLDVLERLADNAPLESVDR